MLDLIGEEQFWQAHAATRRAYYDGSVRVLDAEVGRFLEALRERGEYDASLIVITADHGEAFWRTRSFRPITDTMVRTSPPSASPCS
jgi:arylsulfatase A-like enzyme